MLKVSFVCVLALCLVSVSFAAPAEKSVLLKKTTEKASAKNLGYTSYNEPSYKNNMGGSYSTSYNQAPYQPAPYQPAPYQPAPYQPAPYQPAPYQRAPYQSAPYSAYPSAPYAVDPYYKSFETYTPTTWDESVEEYPDTIELTVERLALIKQINDAFKFVPYLYGNSESYGPVNANYDYNSYGSMEFKYFAPRNQNSNYASPNYEKSSSYSAPAYETTSSYPSSYNKNPSYTTPSYTTPSYSAYQTKSRYATPSYNNPSYNEEAYETPYMGPEYKEEPYNKPSYSAPSGYRSSYSAPSSGYKPSYSAPSGYKPY